MKTYHVIIENEDGTGWCSEKSVPHHALKALADYHRERLIELGYIREDEKTTAYVQRDPF